MSDPATYGVEGPVEVHETHASWVFLAGPFAYKVKKPVRLGFLDYSTVASRRAACLEELRVNRELGGDVYRCVLAIVEDAGVLRFAPENAPSAIEYVLQMRRFDERRTLAGLIAAGKLTRRQLVAVAGRLARFHVDAAPCAGGGADAALRTWRLNLRELEQLHGSTVSTQAARRFGEAFIAGHRDELDRRAQAGLVRDGHGDLRCEHVLPDQPVTVVDRIEFDPALRRIDVGCDLAFLLMDLELRRHAQEARQLLSDYRHAGGDPGSEELVWFFAAHWALVRAKVAVIGAGQRPERTSASTRGEAQRLLELSERLCWRARGAIAIVLTGPPASGKSTLAAELAKRSGVPVVSSDETRKRLAGLAPVERAGPESYTRGFTTATYRKLGSSAAAVLAGGSGVIIDATFARPEDRAELLRALDDDLAHLMFFECKVPLRCAIERSVARMKHPDRVSDATPEVVTRVFETYQPIRELPHSIVIEVDGRGPLPAQIETLTAALDARLASGYVVLPDARRVSSAGGGAGRAYVASHEPSNPTPTEVPRRDRRRRRRSA